MFLILFRNGYEGKQLEYFGHQQDILLGTADLTTNHQEKLVEVFELNELFGH